MHANTAGAAGRNKYSKLGKDCSANKKMNIQQFFPSQINKNTLFYVYCTFFSA